MERRSSAHWRAVVRSEQDRVGVRVDVCREVGEAFLPPETFGPVHVDSRLDIAVKKVGCIYTRTEVKDFVDLYFLHRETPYRVDTLLPLAERREGGFDRLMFAALVGQAGSFTPEIFGRLRMRRILALDELRKFYLGLQEEIVRRAIPE